MLAFIEHKVKVDDNVLVIHCLSQMLRFRIYQQDHLPTRTGGMMEACLATFVWKIGHQGTIMRHCFLVDTGSIKNVSAHGSGSVQLVRRAEELLSKMNATGS